MEINDQATIEDVPMEEDDSSDSSDEEDDKIEKKVYLPGKPLEEGEELTYDESAYVMLHQAHTGAPCLSFDVITDNYGSSRTTFPMSGYIIAGTQAAKAHANRYKKLITVLPFRRNNCVFFFNFQFNCFKNVQFTSYKSREN